MAKFKGIDLIAGKFYVVDQFSGPVSGPFDTVLLAENDRQEMNIDEDCYVGECKVDGSRYTIGNDQVATNNHSCETCGSDTDEPTVICEGCSEGND